MGTRVSVVVLVCAVVALVVLAPATARPAAASCMILKFSLDIAAKVAETVIVGEVISERGGEDLYSGYESTIRVVSALKGATGQEVTLSPLSFGKCPAGPRLMTGESVLLFISRPHGTALYESGKYLLAEGEARTKHFPPIPADDALRRVAAITGATNEQLDAALAFAGVGPAPPPDAEPIPPDAPQPDAAPLPVDVEDGGQPALLIALASALLALLVAALASLGLRRAR